METTQQIQPAFAGAQANQTRTQNDTRSRTTLSSDFETFLKMLTVQMQNQDPLNPIESSEYAVQLATFSSVEQQVLTNDLLAELSDRLTSSGMGQLSGWLGLEGRAEMPLAFDGSPVSISTHPDSLADEAILVVRDRQGALVQRQLIPTRPETVVWAGVDSNGQLVPHGTYSVEVESYANGEFLSSRPALVYGQVVEARKDDGQLMLVMKSGHVLPSTEISGLRDPSL